jgi:hypothetical protein
MSADRNKSSGEEQDSGISHEGFTPSQRKDTSITSRKEVSVEEVQLRAESERNDTDNIAAIRRSLGLAESTDQSFAASLRPTNFDVGNVKIWQLESDPSVLVRESKIGEGETLDALEASTHEAETLFAEMRAKYGIRVISMSSRREKNKEGKETMFTLVDKIEGKNLSKIESLPVEARDELEALYLSLGLHYYDAWKSKYEAGGIKKQQEVLG